MKLSESDRRKAYKRAYALLDEINRLLNKARVAHEKMHNEQNRQSA